MPDVDDHPGLRLSPQVQARIRELFDGKVCCRCGRPAARIVGALFFCQSHYREKAAREPHPTRVYRVSGA